MLTVLFTALGKSASSRMIEGDLPPSSRATRLTVSAAAAATRRPAAVEPVKDTMSTSRWRTSASPTVGPRPITMLKTPGGKPTLTIASASA
ncbi:MAG: hypothetical protein K0Q76_78 [Panacagrimonas sp.]|nr:hypothetical protein [Panacagrimonas sp.]